MRITASPSDDMASPTGALSAGSHFFQLGGITQRYHVYGSGPICVAHPGGPGLVWNYLRMPSLEEHLTMVYVEPIGTGESGRLPSHPHGYTHDRYSRFLQLVINRLQRPEVHLLGHSHGALVAAHHALHRPEQLAGLILYEDAVSPGGNHATACDEAQAACISGLDEYFSPVAVDNRADLREVTLPTLVITGSHHPIRSPGWGRELHSIIPHSRLHILEHSDSLGHVHEPEHFSAVVRDFVLATSGSGRRPSGSRKRHQAEVSARRRSPRSG